MEMVMSFKSFVAPKSKNHVSFELGGETFHCRPSIAAGALIDLALMSSDSDNDDNKKGAKSVKSLMSFFRAALMKSDYKKFIKVIHDPDAGVSISLLGEVAGWIAGEASERPTGEASSDTSTSESSGGESTANSSPEALTYSRSLPTEPAA